MTLFTKEILKSLHIEVFQSKFLMNHYKYPIKIVVFEGRELGLFDSSYYHIGLNRKLIYQVKDSVLRDILKHEVAHYLTFIHYGQVEKPHGPEFKEICHRYGLNSEVAKSSIDLHIANALKEGDLKSDAVLEKVKKLLALAQSSNSHEAELATLKANQILLKHNLEYLEHDDEPIFMTRLLRSKKSSQKMNAICSILKYFMVFPVMSRGEKTACIEVSGTQTNVKLAEYIANFLNVEFEHLWRHAQKEYQFRGLRAKNSFFRGVAQGFIKKIKEQEVDYNQSQKNSLTIIKNQMTKKCEQIYGRLSSIHSYHKVDQNAHHIGHLKGKDLTIKKAVTHDSSKEKLRLPNLLSH